MTSTGFAILRHSLALVAPCIDDVQVYYASEHQEHVFVAEMPDGRSIYARIPLEDETDGYADRVYEDFKRARDEWIG